jgi:DNA repair photolyase
VSELRWRPADDPMQPGLFERSRRVVGRGEYRSLTFWEVEARSLVNRVPNSAGLPFEYTINAYRGCSHRCSYCFARPTHTYLGFDPGSDFDSQIVVKTNAVELARAETSPGRWGGHPIAMGTNTDPYQKAEGRYRLTRGIAEVLVERRNVFSILTKSTLALRDLDVFVEAARHGLVTVSLSVGTLDETVWKLTEPGAPHPRQRLEAVARLTEVGVPSGVLVAPIIPGLSDADEQVAAVKEAALAAGATSVGTITMHLKTGLRQHWFEWLQANVPGLVDRHRRLYQDRVYLGRRPAARPQPPPPDQLSLDL